MSFRTVIFGVLAVLVELKAQTTVGSRFSCEGRPAGYYADVNSGCQIYHMCDGLGRQFSYSCPNTTLFQQRMFICDHWYMVNCSRAENDYSANLLLGQNKPFVEDSEMENRTPRPDLLSQPTASEFNIVFRKTTVPQRNDLNVVGLDSDYDQNNGSTTITEKPAYNLPTHWSTEYSREDTTVAPETRNNFNQQTTLLNKLKNRQESAKAINFNSQNLVNNLKPSKATDAFLKKDNGPPVNFKSLFKNTTPVFPTKDELGTTPSSADEDLLPPELPQTSEELPHVNFKSVFRATTPVFPTKDELGTTPASVDDILQAPRDSDGDENSPPVNFKSFFKNTTPVYPSKVELKDSNDADLQPPFASTGALTNEQNSLPVIFRSNYKNTTPVYPSKQELGVVPSSGEENLEPPKIDGSDNSRLPTNILPPLPDNSHLTRNDTVEPADYTPPSKFFRPPLYEPDYHAITSRDSSGELDDPSVADKTKANAEILEDIREMFSIPDYDFPLDTTVTRPSYGDHINSFQVNPFAGEIMQRQHADS